MPQHEGWGGGRLLLVGAAVFLSIVLVVHAQDAPALGVTTAPGTTTLRVWAPNAQSVAVIGEFNNWKPMSGDHLARDSGADGVWSVNLKRSLPRGAYQFLINGQLRRRDPYAREVTPDGTASLFYDPAAYAWETDTPPRYPLDDLVIYELHIGSFHDPKPRDSMPGTFDDAIKRLDYLAQLGVNTLCLLPVHAFAGNNSWGYNPSDLFAVEQAYGGPDGLKRFVAAAHARGLAVHLDIVHNHYGPHNLDLLQFDGTGGSLNGGIYFYEGDGIGMTPWGPRGRFDEPMVRRFIRDNALTWLDEYRIDGFRWDSTINIRAWSEGAQPIPAGAQMLNDINSEIKTRFPGRWSIAEDSLGIGTFHGSWDYDFHNSIMPVLTAPSGVRDMRVLADQISRGGGSGMARVIYIDNHDEAGKLNTMQRIASDVDPANPGSERARALSALGAVLTFTAPGIPLLFMGNEFQEYGTWHDNTPLDWGKTTRHAGTLTLHRDLIRLRRDRDGVSVGLRGRGVQIAATDREAAQLVYWRTHPDHPADSVVIAINLNDQPADILVPFPTGGSWTLRLDTDWTRYGGATREEQARPFSLPSTPSVKAKTRLAANSARIYSLTARPVAASANTPAPAAPASSASTAPVYFSLYAHLYLTGTFNAWEKTAWPLTLVENAQWEGRFVFRGVENPSFKLSANEDGKINWGGYLRDQTPVSMPYDDTAKRLGTPFVAQGTWDGEYLFRFNEDTRSLQISRLGDAPTEPDPTSVAASSDPAPARRTWTDRQGRTVEATLIEATSDSVTLERPDGRRLTLPLDGFSEPDRAYIQTLQPK